MSLNQEDLKTFSGLLADKKKLLIEEKGKMRQEVMAEVIALVKPAMDKMAENARLSKTELVEFAETVTTNILSKIKIPTPEVTVNVPEVKVPKADVPKAEVIVKVPKIEVPKVTVKAPIVNVKVPEQKALDVKMPEKMKVEGAVSIEGVTKDRGLPVVILDIHGKPIDFASISSGPGGGGKKDYFNIKSIGGNKTLKTGRKVVTAAGTAEVLVDESTPCKEVTIMSETDNGDLIAIGDENVVAAPGTQVGLILLSGGSSVVLKIDNLNKIWIDAGTNGEGVTYAYVD